VIRSMFALILSIVLSNTAALAQTPAAQPPASSPANEELWDAARAGDAARVTKAIEKGADVNAKTRYGATALTFAADKGHVAVVKLLLDKGADVNAQDSFYSMRAVDMAMMNKHVDVVSLLMERGSKGAGNVLVSAVQQGNVALAKTALASSDITRANLTTALGMAKRANNAQMLELLNAKLASMPADSGPPPVTVERSTLQSYVGSYRNNSAGLSIAIALTGEQLTAATPGQQPLTLMPTSQTAFRAVEFEGLSFAFTGRGGTIEQLMLTQGNTTTAFERVSADPAAATAAPAAAPPAGAGATPPKDPDSVRPAERGAARNWPAFRGDNAAGNGDGQGAVVEWDVDTKQNITWKTPIPGISNASPIVWGDRVFVVTAISSAGNNSFKPGLYGDVAPVEDVSEHSWKLYCLDKNTGKVLWERVAFTGAPKVKRHTKSSQANSTPVTDGKRVVAVLGSIGLLAAWDMDGKPLWTEQIGVIDSGWFFDPEYQWGHSSSPIIYGDTVIVQADQQKKSYIAAYNLNTGKQVWRTERDDEIPTWGTPALFRADGKDQIVTNGTKVRGYDPKTGKLLWTLGPNSEVTVGTPVVGEGLVFVTGGYPPVRPIYAVKPTAAGEITLTKEKNTNESIAWSNDQGTYIPSPIFYEGVLYTCGNNGILSAYDAKTGERIYRSRIGGGGSFVASPVAADGRLYLASEEGDIYVVRAGRTYEELAKNEMKEVIVGTPAVSDGFIIVRTIGHVYGVSGK
jgi:outer membrane protein assembly factor BamB